MNNKQTTIALNKVAWMTYYWRTECGQYTKLSKPSFMTVHGQHFLTDEFAPHINGYEQEKMLDRALRLQLLDTWQPCLTVAFSATKHLRFTGDKATSLWNKWQAMQFCKGKKATKEERHAATYNGTLL